MLVVVVPERYKGNFSVQVLGLYLQEFVLLKEVTRKIVISINTSSSISLAQAVLVSTSSTAITVFNNGVYIYIGI